MPMGRPSDYTPELAERICAWLSEGKSLRAFCRKPGTPDVGTVCRWIVKREDFRVQYVQAREAAGFAHADQIVEVVEKVGKGGLGANEARAMMDGLKWSAERMAPKAHMPQSLVNVESPQGTMTPKGLDVSSLSTEALQELMKAKDASES